MEGGGVVGSVYRGNYRCTWPGRAEMILRRPMLRVSNTCFFAYSIDLCVQETHVIWRA